MMDTWDNFRPNIHWAQLNEERDDEKSTHDMGWLGRT